MPTLDEIDDLSKVIDDLDADNGLDLYEAALIAGAGVTLPEFTPEEYSAAYPASEAAEAAEAAERNLEAWQDAVKELDDWISEYYTGCTSVAEYVNRLLDEGCIDGYDADTTAGRYFDVDSFARDLELGGDVTEINGFVFSYC
jgi:Fe-S oxidoreductase